MSESKVNLESGRRSFWDELAEQLEPHLQIAAVELWRQAERETLACEGRLRELERALRDIEIYYSNLYVEGEVNYQAVLIARQALTGRVA